MTGATARRAEGNARGAACGRRGNRERHVEDADSDRLFQKLGGNMAQTVPVRELPIPHLEDDSPESCPVTVEELVRYLRAKTEAKAMTTDDLTFIRTAQVYECGYWVWRFGDRQTDGYALVMRDPEGEAWISCHSSSASLDPQQILLADYRMALQDN
jgi:hypothetical protein